VNPDLSNFWAYWPSSSSVIQGRGDEDGSRKSMSSTPGGATSSSLIRSQWSRTSLGLWKHHSEQTPFQLFQAPASCKHVDYPACIFISARRDEGDGAHLELHDVEAVAKGRKGFCGQAWSARIVWQPKDDQGAHQVRPEQQAQVPRHQRAPVVASHEYLHRHRHHPGNRSPSNKKERLNERKGSTFGRRRWSRSATMLKME
jgi:hypothetical protein